MNLLNKGNHTEIDMGNWHILETTFDPQNLHSRETVFAIGNGYLGTRGTFEEGYPNELSATLVNGLYDDVPIVYSELANTPNWIDFHLFANGTSLNFQNAEPASYRRDLNLRNGVLSRKLKWLLPDQTALQIEFERFASLADEHALALRCRIHSLNFKGVLEIHAGLPAHVDNEGWVHFDWMDQGSIGDSSAFIQLKTRKTQIGLAEAFSLHATKGKLVSKSFWNCRWNPTITLTLSVQPGEEIEVEKLVSVFTQLDSRYPYQDALLKLEIIEKLGYSALLEASEQEWVKNWKRANIQIEGDDEADLAVRFSLFQLLIAAPRKKDRVSIPAKTLSGFGYHGHVFWDTEIFILPFFTFTQPALARNLLMYRYHTLPGARRKAQQSGYQGAQFAWESATTGDESTPRWVPLPDGNLIRIWCGDIEHHITADVAYAIDQYWQGTGDDAFMKDYGAEVVFEAARFFASRVEWDEVRQSYHIDDVIGPDEYHEHVNDNAYTNGMARWTLQRALHIFDWLQAFDSEKADELSNRLNIHKPQLEHWKHIIDHLHLGVDPQTQILEQFEGFFQRKTIDLESFEPRTQSMQAILGIEKAQEYQVLKQPDALMLFYLLGEEYPEKALRANYDYYTPITDLGNGSSLGPSIQAVLAVKTNNMKEAYEFFKHAAETDLKDIRRNSSDGIHAATCGGLWQSVVFGFAGLRFNSEGPYIEPKLPGHWKRLTFSITYRGREYTFDVQAKGTTRRRQPRLPILAAIFDLDGVLTDTSELHFRAWKRLANEEGISFTRQDNESLRGIPRRESLLIMLKGKSVSEGKLEELMNRKNRYYMEYISHLSPQSLLPGTRRFLEQLRSLGIKIAIGSASKNAKTVIQRLQIEDLLDAVADGESVEQQKPAPDLFLHAAELLGVPPTQCVVFEDAAAGVEAALTGGMWCVGIGPKSRVGLAHLVYPNLDEVGADEVIWKLESEGAE